MTDLVERQFETLNFTVGDISFCAKYWQGCDTQHNRTKVIALHGWLDNCASFDVLAPLLNADVLCLDLAGHGYTGHRPHLGAYNVWLDVPEILAIADQLGWVQFNLIGHSRGAAIAFILAATFPHKVEKLICLDGIFPLVAAPEKVVEQLFNSINSVNKKISRKKNVYLTFDDAIKAREMGMFPLVNKDAATLAKWGVAQNEDGFFWRFDSKLLAPSELRLSIEQVSVFAKAIECPLLLVIARQGIILNNFEGSDLLNEFAHWHKEYLDGSHHFHMSEQGCAIAHKVNLFLSEVCQ